jgi:hypothetical protein
MLPARMSTAAKYPRKGMDIRTFAALFAAATVLTTVASPIAAQEPAPNLCLQVDTPAELDTVEAWQIPQLIASGEIAVLAVVDCEPLDEASSEPALTGDFFGVWWITDIVNGYSGTETIAMAATEAQTGTSQTGQPYNLVIRCSDGQVDLMVTWNDVIEAESPVVETMVGSMAAESQMWGRSVDGTSTFYPGEAVRPFLESLSGETSLVIRTTPDGSDPWVADFAIDDIENALVNVRTACDW